MARLIKVAEWSGSRRVNVVFIHGLNGHPYRSWRGKAGDETFWPRWLAQDIPGTAVFTLGYVSPATNWVGTALPLLDEAVSISRLLANEPDLINHPIIFVCHSLGGLIVKQVLRDAKERSQAEPALAQLYRHTRLVMFLGTPHTGAGKATLLEKLRLFAWGSDSARDLVANNPTLRNLNTGYRTLAEERRDLSHLVYFEMGSTILGRIVDPASADPGLPNCRPIPVREDHIRLAKIADRADPIYHDLKNSVGRLSMSLTDPGQFQVCELPTFKAERFFAPIIQKIARALLVVIVLYISIHVVVGLALLFGRSGNNTSLNQKLAQDLQELRLNYVSLSRPPNDALFVIDYFYKGSSLSRSHPQFAGPFPFYGKGSEHIGEVSVNVTDVFGMSGVITANSDGSAWITSGAEDSKWSWYREEFSPIYVLGAKFKEALGGMSMRRLLSEMSSQYPTGYLRLRYTGDEKTKKQDLEIMLKAVDAYFKFYVQSREDGEDDCASIIVIPVSLVQDDPQAADEIRLRLRLEYQALSVNRCEKFPF